MDLNRTAIEAGSRAFDLDLRVADETALANIPKRSFDISFTVSVLDHIALPEHTIARLAAITQRFSITYEICHDKTGKIQSMQDATGNIIDAYPCSYFHDYRSLFANAGCWLLLDAARPSASRFPTGCPARHLSVWGLVTQNQFWCRTFWICKGCRFFFLYSAW